MNKDFMLLNDNTIEVTNEYGQEINRGEFENNNVKDILLAENKVELIDYIEGKLQKINNENKGVIVLSDFMLQFSSIFLVLTPLIGFISGAITYPSNYIIAGLSNGIYFLIFAVIPISVFKIYYKIKKSIYKRKIQKVEKAITKTNKMKKQYEEELQLKKEKTVTNTIEHLVKVSLEKDTYDIATQIAEEMQEFTEREIKQKGKIRIRKR